MDASGGGALRVALLDPASGRELAGRGLAHAVTINSNAVRVPVSWNSGGDVSGLAGHAVVVLFELSTAARLYAFQFVQSV